MNTFKDAAPRVARWGGNTQIGTVMTKTKTRAIDNKKLKVHGSQHSDCISPF